MPLKRLKDLCLRLWSLSCNPVLGMAEIAYNETEFVGHDRQGRKCFGISFSCYCDPAEFSTGSDSREETHDMGLRVAFYPYMVYNKVGFVDHTYSRRAVAARDSDFGGI